MPLTLVGHGIGPGRTPGRAWLPVRCLAVRSAGDASASQVWSLTGIAATMRADVADLLTLPALYGAWLVHRGSVRTARLPARQLLATATGMALLPVAVLATAATNCSEIERITSVSL